MLKKILYRIIGIIVLLLVIAALLPKDFEVTTETTIKAPQAKVRDYVKLLGNQKNYSVRVMADPNVKIMYSGSDGTVGAIQSWESENKNVGVGAQEITKMEEGTSYEVELRFEKPMKSVNHASTTLMTTGDQTIVTTKFRGDAPWPFNLLCNFFTPTIRKDMEQNGANLKKILEG